VSTVYYHHARILCSTFSTDISDNNNNNNTQQIRFVSVTSSFFGKNMFYFRTQKTYTRRLTAATTTTAATTRAAPTRPSVGRATVPQTPYFFQW